MKIFNRIKRNYLLLKKQQNDIKNYNESYQFACEFSNTSQFQNACHLDKNIPPVSSESCTQLIDMMDRQGVPDLSYSAGQCLKWSVFIAPIVEQALGIKAWPTLGQLWKKEEPIYDPSWGDVSNWIKKGLTLSDLSSKDHGLTFHVWVTLENGQILDPTYLATLANFFKWGERYNGEMIFGYPEEALKGHNYIPMLVGQD